MLMTLDDAAVHRWCGSGLAALRAHQHEIDELNVYPVPDGDTGTNLVLTLTAAAEALEQETAGALEREAAGALEREAAGALERETAGALERQTAETEPSTPLGRAMRRMARGALLGARGNSGVIVSQILRGMADSFATTATVRGGDLARALRTATEAAYAAVAQPVEGTVLSVVAAAAEGAGRIKSDDVVAVAQAAARAAAEALARTPQQLPVLARAGVVDAGGRGLCLLLDALVEALSGNAPVRAAEPARNEVGISAREARNEVGTTARREETAREARNEVGTTAREARNEVGTTAREARNELGTTARPEESPREARRIAGDGEKASRWDGHTGGEAGNLIRRDGDLTVRDAPEVGNTQFGYEVQYLLDARPAAVDALRARLAELGDSLVIVGSGEGDPPTWNVHVHVHVDDIGAAVEAGVEAGRPHRISVTPLEDRPHHEEAAGPAPPPQAPQPVIATPVGRPATPPATPPAGAEGRGAVVVAAGDGLTALFEAEGAIVVDRNPSIAEMLAAITATGADQVVLLPNDANTHAVATSAAREAATTGVRVSVVPTRSPVQALAALAVRDPEREFSDDVIAMAEAAGACRYGEVCTARREALTVAGRCRPGDLLGLVDGEVHIIGGELTEVCRGLIDRMLGGGGELVTLVLGADAPQALEHALREHVCQAWPFVELQCYAGGQPRYHLLVGVE